MLYKLHLWFGLLLTLPLLFASLTGGLLLFKNDIVRATVAGAERVLPPTPPAQIGADIERVEQLFGHSLRSVRLADDRIGLHEIWLDDGRGAYFDPVTQRIVKQWDRAASPLDILFDLHHELLAGSIGRAIMGAAALLASMQLLGGLWLWYVQPKAFRGVVWPPPGRSGLLMAHRDLAALIAVPALVVLLSGATLAFPNAARAALNAALPGENAAFVPPEAGPGDVDWRVALPLGVERFPDAVPRIVVWPAAPGAAAIIRLRQSAEWHPNGRTVVYIDSASNKVLATRDAFADSLGTRVANTAYPLHAATIARPWLRWLALIVTLSLMLLVIYGLLAWIRR